MDRIPKYLKNKYIIALMLFMVYVLFLDDYDIFTLFRYHSRNSEIKAEISLREKQIDSLNVTLNKLNNLEGVERYAREKKYYKKDDEDIFVIFKE